MSDSTIKAVMYGRRDEEVEGSKPPVSSIGSQQKDGTLDRQVRDLKKLVEEQGRMLKRLQTRLGQLERLASKQGRALNDVERDLENKLDKRGW